MPHGGLMGGRAALNLLDGRSDERA